ncbi:TetR/AcrR family transcriptional regulator [Nonomuraea guangzhouensis]|uniref:TetR/AcrR family transcriptional regulator n=1 Tax=Nonomuraea guangzhouensis TaxID=1291555 RepID=A0ABW4GW98_9ACTN|nr:helix-turn-helix domain-containing protein [Nonomuraea guangzhouensis]
MNTRDRIIDAAEQAIHEYGLAGATTKRIASQAGCSEALLYKHFPGKEALLLAVLLERLPALAPALAALRERLGEGDLAGNLTEFALAAVDFYGRAAGIASGMISDPSLLSTFRDMLAKGATGPHLPIEVLAEVLRAEQRLGRLDGAIDAGAAASLLMGACFHRAHLAFFTDLAQPADAWAAAIVATLIRR